MRLIVPDRAWQRCHVPRPTVSLWRGRCRHPAEPPKHQCPQVVLVPTCAPPRPRAPIARDRLLETFLRAHYEGTHPRRQHLSSSPRRLDRRIGCAHKPLLWRTEPDRRVGSVLALTRIYWRLRNPRWEDGQRGGGCVPGDHFHKLLASLMAPLRRVRFSGGMLNFPLTFSYSRTARKSSPISAFPCWGLIMTGRSAARLSAVTGA